jgi:nitrosocyanin
VSSKFGLRVLLGLALIALVAACSGAAAPTQGTQTVTLNALDTFKYDPNTITGKVGQPIHVVINNKGVLEHSFAIDQFNVKLEHIQAGTTGEVTFTPTAAGTYTFYCDTPGHKEAGMTGTLTVTQ